MRLAEFGIVETLRRQALQRVDVQAIGQARAAGELERDLLATGSGMRSRDPVIIAPPWTLPSAESPRRIPMPKV